nr:homolog of EHV2 ORF35 tegument protein UL14 [Macronycteris gammaherpesvirus 1]
MASSKKPCVDLIAKGLEAEINKKASVSIFDRFGSKNPLFKKQFGDTQRSLRQYTSAQSSSNIENSLKLIDQTLENKSKELHLLSQFNKSKLSKVEKICEAVTELKEDFDFELETLGSIDLPENDTTTGGNYECNSVTDTIMEWKTDLLPQVPNGCP